MLPIGGCVSSAGSTACWGPWPSSPEPQTPEKSFLPASHLDENGIGQTQQHRALLWSRLSVLSFATAPTLWLVGHRPPACFDLYCLRHRRSGCSAGWSPCLDPFAQTR